MKFKEIFTEGKLLKIKNGDMLEVLEDFDIQFRYTPLYTNSSASKPRTVEAMQGIKVLKLDKISKGGDFNMGYIEGKFLISGFKKDKNYANDESCVVELLQLAYLIKV